MPTSEPASRVRVRLFGTMPGTALSTDNWPPHWKTHLRLKKMWALHDDTTYVQLHLEEALHALAANQGSPHSTWQHAPRDHGGLSAPPWQCSPEACGWGSCMERACSHVHTFSVIHTHVSSPDNGTVSFGLCGSVPETYSLCVHHSGF